MDSEPEGWNFRLIRAHPDDDRVDLAEVDYDSDGRPTSWRYEVSGGFCIVEIEQLLMAQRAALSRPVLLIVTDGDDERLVDTGALLPITPDVPAGQSPVASS